MVGRFGTVERRIDSVERKIGAVERDVHGLGKQFIVLADGLSALRQNVARFTGRARTR